MTTTNLALETINSSDYVDPEVFNSNYTKIDKLGVDYITEQGTSGEWWYRKWNSGRAECGIDDKEFGDMSHNTSWGSMYTTPSQSFPAYPFSFSSRPFANITFNSDETKSSGTHTSYVAQETSNSTTQPPKFRLVDPNSGTVTKPHFGIYVCGKYK